MRIGLVAFLVSLLVSPLGLALVVVLVERRPFVLSEQYMAFLVGDVLLAVAVGIGFSRAGDRPLWSWWLLIPLVAGAAFGWWQLGHEVTAGVYTSGEAHSPAKLYHQFVCYPVLLALTSRALWFAWGRWAAFAAMAVLIAGWVTANVWDGSHPKTPHRDFDWSTFSTVKASNGDD